MTTTPTTPADDRVITEGPNAWYRDHGNLVTLVYWMAEGSYDKRDIVHAVEKVWKWTPEFIAAKHDVDEGVLNDLMSDDDNVDTLESRILAFKATQS